MLSGHVPGEPFSLSSLLAPGRARCLPLPQTAGTCGRCGRAVLFLITDGAHIMGQTLCCVSVHPSLNSHNHLTKEPREGRVKGQTKSHTQ